MYPHIFTEKNTKAFIKEVFSRYVETHGCSLSKLEHFSYSSATLDFPDQFYETVENTRIALVAHYSLELVARAYLEQDNLKFKLTVKGYTQGYKYKHPIQYFLREHWKVYLPILTGTGLVIVGILNYVK